MLPDFVRISWPTMTVSSGASVGPSEAASSAPSMRSWSVIAM